MKLKLLVQLAAQSLPEKQIAAALPKIEKQLIQPEHGLTPVR
jgi:hypothetical protein